MQKGKKREALAAGILSDWSPPQFLQTLVPRCFDVNAFCQRRGFSRVDYCFLRVYSGKEYSLLCVWPGTTLPFCDIAISHINLVQLNANGI